MKRVLFIVSLALLTIHNASAQDFTKSYGCVSVLTSMGPQAPPVGLATWIEFYDDYILIGGYEEFEYSTTNYDGSKQYVATKQGPPAMNTIGWVVSKDYSTVKQVVQSSMMGMTMQMEYGYRYIGEGSSPAQTMMESSSSYGGGGYDSDYTCSSCGGTRQCKYCNGTGYYEYGQNGRCGVCRGTGRCQACNR